jgi:heptose I phosphotransferase
VKSTGECGQSADDEAACERWDGGRVRIGRPYAELFRRHGLTTFDSVMDYRDATVAKDVLRERTTVRIELTDADGMPRSFYVKRHTPSPWKEYVKPLLRLRRPILGARNEWEAIHHFRRIGIPTMTPVALGEDGRRSFLITEAIEGCVKLSEWLPRAGVQGFDGAVVRERIAETARRMHAAGLHHQDFYLTHLLVPTDDARARLYVIDLGRVQHRPRLASRWVIKDLAQLAFSARSVPGWDDRDFLARYLGRPLSPSDRRLERQIVAKVAAIHRHSRKNRL